MKQKLLILLCISALNACAATPNPIASEKEPSMNTPDAYIGHGKTRPESPAPLPEPSGPIPVISPQELMTRFLHFADSSTFAQLTPEYLAQMFGVPIARFFYEESGNYGFILPAAGQWFQMVKVVNDGRMVRFSFILDHADKTVRPELVPVCGMSLDDFADAAEARGFRVQAVADKGVVLQGARAEKSDRVINILSAAAHAPDEKRGIGKACIEMMTVSFAK